MPNWWFDEKKPKNLDSRVDKLEEIIEKQEELIQFLCNYNKDEVVVTGNPCLNPTIQYIYKGQLYKVPFDDVNLLYSSYSIVTNKETQTIIKVEAKEGIKPRFYVLDKIKKVVVRVPDDIGDTIND